MVLLYAERLEVAEPCGMKMGCTRNNSEGPDMPTLVYSRASAAAITESSAAADITESSAAADAGDRKGLSSD